jgi:hypothetical protein
MNIDLMQNYPLTQLIHASLFSVQCIKLLMPLGHLQQVAGGKNTVMAVNFKSQLKVFLLLNNQLTRLTDQIN